MTFVTLQTLALYSLLAGTPKTAEENKADKTESARSKKAAKPVLTPMDQSNTDRDVKITTSIRQELMNETELSVTAKNVKIITRGGEVTLRGAVNSKAEREIVCAAAARIVGIAHVDDQLELPAAKPANTN